MMSQNIYLQVACDCEDKLDALAANVERHTFKLDLLRQKVTSQDVQIQELRLMADQSRFSKGNNN